MKLSPHHTRLLSGQSQSPQAKLLRCGLSIAAGVYRPIIALRNGLFDTGLRSSHSLARPSISIGNLTTGGTGKTPIVMDITRKLIALHRAPAILLRGYHAHQGLSDEAQLLANALSPHASVHANPSRRQAAKDALANHPTIDCFVLDDGFQHRQAQRDLDLILIDATNPFGYGHLLPRGLLREPMSALKRADGLIITRANLVSANQLHALKTQLHQVATALPIFTTLFEWASFLNEQDHAVDSSTLQQHKLLGVCGVGNPAAFEKMLKDCFGTHSTIAFDDHHIYTGQELNQLFQNATDQGMTAIITTEKDWVKWHPLTPATGWPLPIYRPYLGVQWLEGEDTLHTMLQKIFKDTLP